MSFDKEDNFKIMCTLETVKRSALDILRETPGRRIFHTAAEVDAYLSEERNAWDS